MSKFQNMTQPRVYVQTLVRKETKPCFSYLPGCTFSNGGCTLISTTVITSLERVPLKVCSKFNMKMLCLPHRNNLPTSCIAERRGFKHKTWRLHSNLVVSRPCGSGQVDEKRPPYQQAKIRSVFHMILVTLRRTCMGLSNRGRMPSKTVWRERRSRACRQRLSRKRCVL